MPCVKSQTPCSRTTLFAAVISGLLLFSLTSNASAQVSRVSVTINTVNSKACVDQFIFCGKADMMVRVGLRQPDGTMTFCPDTTPIVNFDNIGPLSSCSGVPIEPPFDVVISLFDVDESNVPPKPGTSIIIQGQFQLSSNSADAVIPWFRLGAGTIAITGPQANLGFTITITPVAPAFQGPTLAASPTSIDPTLGDRVFVSDHLVMSDDRKTTYPAVTHILISVQPLGGASQQIANATINGSFNLDWDGKLNGQPAPAGNYVVTATLATGGAMESTQVTIASVPKVFEVQNPPISGAWNPRAGPLNFPYRLNPGAIITTRVDGPAPAGSACAAGTALPIAAPSTSQSTVAGGGSLPVQMKNAGGNFLPSGNYCAHFDAKTNSGTVVGSVAKEINLNNAPPLRLVVSLSPAIPALETAVPLTPGDPTSPLVPSMPLFVDAHAFDDLRNDRPTGTITVRAMPSLVIPINPSAISTATCTSTAVCRVLVSPATLALAGGSPTGAGTLAFDATASDLPDFGPSAPASASFPTREAFITVPSPDMTVEVSVPVTGVSSTGFTLVPRNSTIDVAFHAGTGLDLSVAAQANTFSDIVDRSLRLFLGGNTSVGDTTTMPGAGAPNVAFWMTLKPATVVVGSTNPPNLCDRTHVEYVPFAEVQAIIHTVKCRDNADPNGATFSAELGGGFPVENIVWHEFHHAAYDLADEYSPDGGYFETSDFPNVMSNANECTLTGAVPSLCAQIGTTGWWRAAPNPDVMIDNTHENLDETRRATLIFNRCKGGQC